LAEQLAAGLFIQDRSAVSRAAQRMGEDAQLMITARKILEQLQSEKNQR